MLIALSIGYANSKYITPQFNTTLDYNRGNRMIVIAEVKN